MRSRRKLKQQNSLKDEKRPEMGSASKKADAEIAAMSVDQFFASGLDSDGDSTDIPAKISKDNDKTVSNGTHNKQGSRKDPTDSTNEESTSDEGENEEDFQKSLGKLKESDPEFYKFLQENDRDVLQFDEEQDNRGRIEDEDSADDGDRDSDVPDSAGVSLADISRWRAALAGNQAKSALNEVTAAFRSAVQRVSGSDAVPYSAVDDPEVFNALVRLCLTEVPRAVSTILKLDAADKDPTKSKRWLQAKGPVKRFLTDVIKLLSAAGSAGMQRALLRHLLLMTPYLAAEERLCKSLISRLVSLWSSGEEEVRVLAFVNMYRLTQRNQPALLDTVLMKAYLAYVKNCAFTSSSTWPNIHLMRRSLVELYSIDPAASYQRAFLYIRQLAIHLRNAKLDKKKFQVVYNWQYVHCLLLWSALIGEDRSEELRLLLYPLTQIMLGAVNLVATARHYPLRLHITRALTQLSVATATFIPVLPLLLQVLHQTDFNRRGSRVSMRPLDMSCMLRFSEAELKENGFRDSVFDGVLAGLVEYLHVECCSLAFPELVVMARLQLKEFLAKCKVRAYNQRMKELLDKIKANSAHLEEKRQTLPFELSDHEAVRRWEAERRDEGTPFTAFYQNWRSRQLQQSRAKPGKDSKISIRDEPAAIDFDEAADDDELEPFNESDDEEDADTTQDGSEDGGERRAAQQLVLESESDIGDEGDTLEPMKPPKKKRKKLKPKASKKLIPTKSKSVVRVR